MLDVCEVSIFSKAFQPKFTPKPNLFYFALRDDHVIGPALLLHNSESAHSHSYALFSPLSCPPVHFHAESTCFSGVLSSQNEELNWNHFLRGSNISLFSVAAWKPGKGW